MRQPSISVIVLNTNNRRYLEDCFASLSQQDYPAGRFELVLADNASTDGSVEFVRERFPQVRIIAFDRNHGFSIANNLAAAQVEGEFVAFLNEDTRVEPHWLSGLVEALGDEPEVICAGSKMLSWDGQRIDFGGTLLSFLGHGRADGFNDPDLTAYDHHRYILAACGGAMLIDRRVFLDVGGFDEDFKAYFEDIDLGWRLWILGHKVVFAPQSICYHIHFGSSSKQPTSRVQYLYERNALYTIIKNFEPQYLERVLPLALFMQTKRAYLWGQMAGVDMEECRYNLSRALPAARPTGPYNAAYYGREAWRTLRADGLAGLARKIVDEWDRRRGRPVPVSPGQPDLREQPNFWIEQACLAATNDVIENMATMLQKRAAIQGGRRRSDREIFTTVRALSFDVCFDTPEYRRAQERLIELFGIPELFGDIYDPQIPFALRT